MTREHLKFNNVSDIVEYLKDFNKEDDIKTSDSSKEQSETLKNMMRRLDNGKRKDSVES